MNPGAKRRRRTARFSRPTAKSSGGRLSSDPLGSHKLHRLKERFRVCGDEKVDPLSQIGQQDDDGYLSKLRELLAIDPPTPDQKIWRYMDFAQFVSLLHERALFFSSIHSLAQTHDPFEGSIPKYLSEALNATSEPELVSAAVGKAVQHWIKNVDRRKIFVNCWHMTESESDAMWKIYGKSSYSLCIQSTFRQLQEWLPKHVVIGKVQYELKDSWREPIAKKPYLFMFKNEALKHEQELRAIIYDPTEMSALAQFYQDPPIKSFLDRSLNPVTNPGNEKVRRFLGTLISLAEEASGPKSKAVKSPGKDLCHLINKIHVAPKSGDWFMKTVKRVCCQNPLSVEVCNSDLDDEPKWREIGY